MAKRDRQRVKRWPSDDRSYTTPRILTLSAPPPVRAQVEGAPLAPIAALYAPAPAPRPLSLCAPPRDKPTPPLPAAPAPARVDRTGLVAVAASGEAALGPCMRTRCLLPASRLYLLPAPHPSPNTSVPSTHHRQATRQATAAIEGACIAAAREHAIQGTGCVKREERRKRQMSGVPPMRITNDLPTMAAGLRTPLSPAAQLVRVLDLKCPPPRTRTPPLPRPLAEPLALTKA